MARQGQRQQAGRRTPARNQRRGRPLDNEGIIPVLARAVREVETAVQRGAVSPSTRTKYQVVALLVREERANLKADAESTEAQRAEQLKRLDGIATILAKTAARDTSLLQLLAEDAEVSDSARDLRRRMLEAGGVELPEEEPEEDEPLAVVTAPTRRVMPASPFTIPAVASSSVSGIRPPNPTRCPTTRYRLSCTCAVARR